MRGRPPSIQEEDILDAARDVFRENGHAATTAKIAERAGVSEGILFYRYRSKEALLAAVIHRETQPPESLHDIVRTADERSVAENLERILESLLEGVSRANPFLELALTSPTSGVIHKLLLSKAKKLPPQRIVEMITGYVNGEVRLGRVRAVDGTVVARAIFGACIDYVRSRRGTDGAEDRRAFARGLADILLRGIARSDPPRRKG
jgi:AcrR family transcriptional regulator